MDERPEPRKVLDDLLDLINYAAFIYCQIDNISTPVEALYQAAEMYISRKEEYRDAWREMKLRELVAGLRLKTGRIDALLKVYKMYGDDDDSI